MGVVVTTTVDPLPRQVARARAVAARCGAPFQPRRRSLAAALAEGGAEVAYVVGRAREELCTGTERIAVHAGLTASRVAAGPEHPLIRAVAPEGPGSVGSLVDGTLGLAQDALHLAAVLRVAVLGIEASPVVASLLEEGLTRLGAGADPAVAAAARGIRVVRGRCADVLAGEPADAHDVVFLAPMFESPGGAPPGYALFRAVAVPDALDAATVAQALRVAPRLVAKVRAGEPPPDVLVPHAPTRVAGKAVDFWVVSR